MVRPRREKSERAWERERWAIADSEVSGQVEKAKILESIKCLETWIKNVINWRRIETFSHLHLVPTLRDSNCLLRIEYIKKNRAQKKRRIKNSPLLFSSNLRSDLVWVYPVEYWWLLRFFNFCAEMDLIHQLSDFEDVHFTFCSCLSVLWQFESCNFFFLCGHGV